MEKVKKGNGSYVLEMFKALIIGLIISLIFVLIMAFAVTMFDISENMTVIINQIIKGISIFIAALLSLKLPKNGWLRGLVFGILYIALAFVVFSLLDKQFVFDISLLYDTLLGGVTGLISGIVAVNIIKRKA